MLHITDGESVAGTLRESKIPGVVSVYGDMMYEGPAPAGLDAPTWRETRARFMAEAGFAPLEEARRYLKSCDDALAAFAQHDEVVIWLDPRLSNQLILIKVLDWFGRQDLATVRLSLICADRYSGIDDFVGLGRLTADQLASLADTRLPVGEAQLRTAEAAWNAFTSPNPTEIQRFLETEMSALPFLAGAFRRHLEQFPAVGDGLSRTEHQALSVLLERGSLSGPLLFVSVQHQEEWVFMGDSSFYRIMADLSLSRHPLVSISDSPGHGLGEVTITETGRRVIEGQTDHVELNGIDRWLGGIHLKGREAGWRWDRKLERIVSS